MMDAQGFARQLLVELRGLDQRAHSLQMKGRPDQVLVGIEDEGHFVPLLRLAAGSAKFNKMMLFLYHQQHWQPTFEKGTPKMLAELLAGELNHVWTIPLSMIEENPNEPSPETQ